MIRYVIILVLLSACMVSRNEYGKRRYNINKFSIKINQGEEEKIKNIIDLDAIYTAKIIYPKMDSYYHKSYQRYKFYKNGRVGIFVGDDLEPKKAQMGGYEVKEEGIYIEYFSYSIQAGYFRVKILLREKEKNIYGYYGNHIYIFKKEKIEGIFSDNPDW